MTKNMTKKSALANSRTPEYLVVCYAVHDRKVASCDGFNDFNEAVRFLEEDAKNVHREEYMNNDRNASIDFYEGTAKVTSCGDYIWTWEIIVVFKPDSHVAVCYAVHDKHIVSCDGFNDFNEAVRFLEEDAKNVHREELMNNDRNATIDFCEGMAKVTSCGDYIWTWEIVTAPVLNEVSKEEN